MSDYFGNPSTPATIIFPSIAPNFVKNVTPSNFGLRVFESEDSSETRRIAYHIAHNTKLDFSYEGRTAEELAVFIRFYNHCRGSYYPFSLPRSIFQHPEPYLTSIEAMGGVSYWRFESPLEIQTVVVNVYSFNIKLISLGDYMTVPQPNDSSISPFIY